MKRYLHEKMAFLNKQGGAHEHVLIVPGARTEMRLEGASRIHTIHSPLISKESRYRALLDLREVGDILRKENPDIIESSDPYQIAWKSISMGRELGCPVVAYYHSHFAEIARRVTERRFGHTVSEWVNAGMRQYVRNLYQRFAVTLIPSKTLAEILKSWGIANVRVLPLGVDATVFRPGPDDRAETRRSLGIRPERTVLLYVGRFSGDKNVRVLFEAFDLRGKDVNPTGSICWWSEMVRNEPGSRRWCALARMSAGFATFRIRMSWPGFIGRRMSLCIPASTKHLAWWRWKARPAGHRLSAFGEARWTRLSCMGRSSGRAKIRPAAWPTRSGDLSNSRWTWTPGARHRRLATLRLEQRLYATPLHL